VTDGLLPRAAYNGGGGGARHILPSASVLASAILGSHTAPTVGAAEYYPPGPPAYLLTAQRT
jgi:hypothetical protein